MKGKQGPGSFSRMILWYRLQSFSSKSPMLDSKDTKKLFFECLCQIVRLRLGEVHASNDHFSAGERGMIGKSFSNRARNILKEEVGQTSIL